MFRNYSHDPKDPSNKHSFEIYDVDVSIVNGIRRTILTDIPIPGIIGEETPTVEIIRNDGPLHNEIISHRIGLLPVCLTEDEIENYDDNSIQLELNMLNEANIMKNVTSGDISGTLNDKPITKKDMEKIFPKNNVTDSHILITRLRMNEGMHFKASVVKKTARFNSAFSPVSLANFFYMQDPAIADKKEGILEKERSFYTNEFGEANVMKFEIEPINNNLLPRYLVSKAIEIIIGKLENLIANITSRDIGTNGVKMTQFEGLPNTYEFNIQNEDDTLGNIIQSIVHGKYVRNAKSKIDNMHCSYIGYICPHPLKAEMNIRITLDDETNPGAFIKFMETNCRIIVDMLSNIKTEWNKFSK